MIDTIVLTAPTGKPVVFSPQIYNNKRSRC
nr:MAG TPA: hypothetical protein [Caudoviricetes sp.]